MNQFANTPKEAYKFLGQYIDELNTKVLLYSNKVVEKDLDINCLKTEIQELNLKIAELTNEISNLRQKIYKLQYQT